jgi:translation elongation factor EF-Ts
MKVNCETDFVARTDLFKNFIARLLETLVQNKISLDFSDVSNETKTQEGINHFLINSQLNSEKPLFPEDLASKHSNILEIQKLLISKLQENVKIRRILTFSQKNPGHSYSSYFKIPII